MFAGFVFIILLVSFTLSFASIDVKASVGNVTKSILSCRALAVDKFDNFYVTDPQSDPGCRMKPVSQDLIAMVTLLHNGNFLGYKLESVI